MWKLYPKLEAALINIVGATMAYDSPARSGSPHPNPLPKGEGSIALSPNSGGELERGLAPFGIPNKQTATQPEDHMPMPRRVAARIPGSVVSLLGIVGPATTCVARLAAGISGCNASHDIY